MTKPFPHERRLQRFAFAALALAAILALVATRQGEMRLFGAAVPGLAAYVLVGAGAIAGVVAILRRVPWLALAAVALLVLATVPADLLSPGLPAWGVALAFAAAALAFAELVHMMGRYEAAHRAVERDGLPEDHLNRVTDEALATLAGRAGLALLLVGLALGLAYLLAFAGPAQWRDALETTSPLGVGLAAMALLGAGALLVLFRGARMPWRRAPIPPTQENAPDVD
ncbi:MAG: hypothetical protein QOE90_1133 [Thermoplasmata archaeon]|jgi:hypothetical protein|nr:hypothetical protein [Thermoplasmata archaeon]